VLNGMSVNGVTGSASSPAAGLFATGSRDIFAGLITSIVSVAYGLSFAALIFTPPLTPWIAYGIAATFLTNAICAAIVAARSSVPFAIAGPDATTVAVTATLVAALVQRLIAEGAPDDLLAPVMIVLALSAALTGILLCVLGLARAGGAIRFIPYPVIGGFLGATGWLMVSGAVRVITDHGLSFATLDALLGVSTVVKLAAGAAIALAFYFGLRRHGESPYLLPGILIAGIAAAHLAFVLTGMSLVEAQAAGWLFKAPAAVGLARTWDLADLHLFPWKMLPGLSGDLFAVVFVTAVSTLLNTTGIEFVTKREADLQRELKTVGVANLTSALLGGYVGTIALNRTTLNHVAGGRGRLSGLTVAAVSALVLMADPGFLAYVPKFVLGGLLLYLGANLIHAWLIDSARRISRLEYASLLAIALIIIQWGFIAGVLIGVIIGCATFAVSASRVNAIKFSFDGSEYRSSLDRGPEELAILAAHGHEIQGMSLQSYLFFGSANRLYQQVKTLFASRPDCRFLLFDFRLVTGMDSSARHSFTQIKQAADELNARLVLVNMSPDLRNALDMLISEDVNLADDLDHALEACEKAVIAAHSAENGHGRSLREWFTQALGNADYAEGLSAACERLEVRQGDIIARQGDPADCMHFILDGRVGIIVKLEDGSSTRVRSLGPHTTIGEMGLVAGRARSATIQAEVNSVLYALSLEAYERIRRENHPLSQALLTYVITVMAERLNFTSRVIGVLRR
jgi:SulP family sulfate permease